MTPADLTAKRSPGRPPIGRQVNFSMSPDMLADIDAAAERDGVSRSEWVRQAVAEKLRRTR